ncbi:MAG: hypothetical protein CL961_02550, partial [Euryarchaeota archaeon]|nr:hypothetical protein [Euryarchaeota archaeon]
MINQQLLGLVGAVLTKLGNTISIAMIFLMLLPTLGAVVPVDAEASNSEEGWWVDTTVDRNQNGIGDMIERHIDNP